MRDNQSSRPQSSATQFLSDAKDLTAALPQSDDVKKFYQDNPYVVIGVAAGLGYLVAGGVPTPFTRRLIRIGMKALFVPIAAAQLKGLAGQGLADSE